MFYEFVNINYMNYISPEGKVFKSYQEYCNSDTLDLDLICCKLLSGERQPQNDKEKKLLQQMEEILANGKGIELYFD